jgi:hypothetical protein
MSVPGPEPVRINGARHVSDDLGEFQCWERLRAQNTGRIGFVHHGRVMILPVNYLVHDHAIYFRTSLEGVIGGPVGTEVSSFVSSPPSLRASTSTSHSRHGEGAGLPGEIGEPALSVPAVLGSGVTFSRSA